MHPSKSHEIARLAVLISGRTAPNPLPKETREVEDFPLSAIEELIRQANFRVPAYLFWTISLLLGAGVMFFGSTLLAWHLTFSLSLIAALAPYFFLLKRANERALNFAEDFPSILHATASSLSAGNSALVAIERAIKLLPENNSVKQEISRLIADLQRGVAKEVAIRHFARDLRLPELSLFRTAFTLSLDSGGKFAPTLERLALVLRDRLTLIQGARAVTAVMRMTANIILGITPILMLLVSQRDENFWTVLLLDETANTIGSSGIMLILFNYLVLRQMSAFKP